MIFNGRYCLKTNTQKVNDVDEWKDVTAELM